MMVSHQEKVSDVLLENRLNFAPGGFGKRARLSRNSDRDSGEKGREANSGVYPLDSKDPRRLSSSITGQQPANLSASSANVATGRVGKPLEEKLPPDLPRAPSPTPSTSSSFSAATTSAALSSRASLSSCRSSCRGSRLNGSSRSHSRPAYASLSYSGYASTSGRRADGRRDRSSSRRYSRSDRYDARDYEGSWSSKRRRRSCYHNAEDRSRSRGLKRSRSRSVANELRFGCTELQCTRCLEKIKPGKERRPISRTLPMEYWVRTPECKEAKARHMDYIDRVAYSREQFIEETVFTCPFTGVQRDILLERNMFPYDVPTDVEHWTLWSRRELELAEMEGFVQQWVKKNHPHVVEWECDNNEGDRSIEWYHVHVFFRLDCPDKSGAKRDPASVYQGPCRDVLAACDGNSSEAGEE